MNTNLARIRLGELLTPVSRPEAVDSIKTYRLLGAHWYAQGLYIKDTLAGSSIKATRVYRVEEGDFVYNRLFAWKGAFAVATSMNHGCYVSNEFPCFRVDAERLNATFLWRYLSRESAWTEALGLSTGGTPTSRNRLKEENLLGMTIPLPPLAEQQGIVAKIDAVAAKVEEAQSLRKQAAEESALLVTSTHVVAAGSRTVRLGDILRLEEHQVRIEVGREYPQVGILGFGGGLFAKPAVAGGQTTYKTFNRLYDGALVLSQVKGWEGAIAVCPVELVGRYASPEYRTFRSVEQEALPEYLAAVVVTPWFCAKLKTLTRGVGARRERIRPEHFLLLSVPMPTLEKQQALVAALAGLRPLKALQAQTAAELDAFLPSILDQAFKGEL